MVWDQCLNLQEVGILARSIKDARLRYFTHVIRVGCLNSLLARIIFEHPLM